jgi:hypothetical protein
MIKQGRTVPDQVRRRLGCTAQPRIEPADPLSAGAHTLPIFR